MATDVHGPGWHWVESTEECAGGSQFVVYTADSPTYPDRMFSLSVYKAHYLTLSGSAIYIGGGCRNAATGMVQPAHLVSGLGTVGQRFAEGATQALIAPDERVILHRMKCLAPAEWENRARRAGFEVILTQEDIVCVGVGGMLP